MVIISGVPIFRIFTVLSFICWIQCIFQSHTTCARKTETSKLSTTPKSRYPSSFYHQPMKTEIYDSDGENDDPIVSKPFEAYGDSGIDSVMYLENNSIKHYTMSSCENPLGHTGREPLSENRDQNVNKNTKKEPLTPTGTPIKNLPFSPSQVRI